MSRTPDRMDAVRLRASGDALGCAMRMGAAGDFEGGLAVLMDGLRLGGARLLDDPLQFAGQEGDLVAEALARWRRH